MAPVLNMKSEGSWFGTSVHMERITQNSSIKPPTRGNNLRHLHAALTAFAERKRRREQIAGRALRLRSAARHRLPVVLRQHRLGIEGIDMGHAAVHHQVDDALCLRRKMRRLGRKRVRCRHAAGCARPAFRSRRPCAAAPAAASIADEWQQAIASGFNRHRQTHSSSTAPCAYCFQISAPAPCRNARPKLPFALGWRRFAIEVDRPR